MILFAPLDQRLSMQICLLVHACSQNSYFPGCFSSGTKSPFDSSTPPADSPRYEDSCWQTGKESSVFAFDRRRHWEECLVWWETWHWDSVPLNGHDYRKVCYWMWTLRRWGEIGCSHIVFRAKACRLEYYNGQNITVCVQSRSGLWLNPLSTNPCECPPQR